MNRRMLKGPILDIVLLNLINSEQENGLHGYFILNAINKSFEVPLRSSTLYLALKLLENQGDIQSFWGISDGRPRKKYKITEKGQNLLHQYSLELKELVTAAVSV